MENDLLAWLYLTVMVSGIVISAIVGLVYGYKFKDEIKTYIESKAKKD